MRSSVESTAGRGGGTVVVSECSLVRRLPRQTRSCKDAPSPSRTFKYAFLVTGMYGRQRGNTTIENRREGEGEKTGRQRSGSVGCGHRDLADPAVRGPKRGSSRIFTYSMRVNRKSPYLVVGASAFGL